MSSPDLSGGSWDIVRSFCQNEGIDCKARFEQFPCDAGLFWRTAVEEAERRTFQWIIPHPPPIMAEIPPRDDEPSGCVTSNHNLPREDRRIDTRETWPTDALARYFPGEAKATGASVRHCLEGRRIEIYPDRLDQCSRDLKLDRGALEVVVVVHELMHALLHTGGMRKRLTSLQNLPAGPTSADVFRFLESRQRRFDRVREMGGKRVLEQHAQLGTWHLLHRCSEPSPNILEDVFMRLMQRQPPEYRISATLRASRSELLWFWMACMWHDGRYEDTFKGYIDLNSLCAPTDEDILYLGTMLVLV